MLVLICLFYNHRIGYRKKIARLTAYRQRAMFQSKIVRNRQLSVFRETADNSINFDSSDKVMGGKILGVKS